MDRRRFLQQSMGAGVLAASVPFSALLARADQGGLASRYAKGYGELVAVKDGTTGLPLLKLPPDFSYFSYGWTGDVMDDGMKTPERHDGMAVTHQDGNLLTLTRNHEVFTDTGAFVDSSMTYDSAAGGGTTNLCFDAEQGKFVRSWASLSGTLANCCGGPTPWGSWLTCEEVVINPGQVVPVNGNLHQVRLKQQHGFVFEVPADGHSDAQPIKGMGQFAHEAVAVDDSTGIVYLTEDKHPSAGFYRYIPKNRDRLVDGGKLQMMQVKQRTNMHTDVPLDKQFDVEWVDIADPTRGHNEGATDGAGVVSQGLAGGGTPFRRLEGCWYAQEHVFFTSTSGGNAQRGQVYALNPKDQTLKLIFESPGKEVLDYPDNLTVSPRGGVVLCEDGSRYGQLMMGLTLGGELFPFAQNDAQLAGEVNGMEGDFRGSEWCGACFSPDGKWLFANLQKPGVTFAITGPWRDGLI